VDSLSFYGNRDWWFKLSAGEIPGHTGVVVRGHNPSQSSASGFVDVTEFGDITLLAAEETMNVVSTSTSDDGSPAGIGAQTALVSGIDDAGDAVSESVTMNGTTNVLTTQAFKYVNTILVTAVGSSGWNVGNITATSSSAATVQCEVDATESLSQNGFYTVPKGKTMYAVQAEFNAAKNSGGTAPIVEFKGYARLNDSGAAWIQLFDKKIDAGDQNELDVYLPFFAVVAAGGQIRFRTDTDQNTTESRVRFYIVLKDV
jgi:hypothetical protein